jgi:hypothetical protein
MYIKKKEIKIAIEKSEKHTAKPYNIRARQHFQAEDHR